MKAELEEMRRKEGISSMASFKYALRDTFRLIFRHWGLSVLTLITAASLFFLLGSSALFSLNVRNMVADVEDDLVITVFMKTGENVESLAKTLRDSGYLAGIEIISPEKGLEMLKAKLGDQARAVSLLGENPLPWSLQLQVKDVGYATPLVRDLMAMPSVAEVVYAGQLADKLSRASYMINRISVATLILAIVITSLVLFNTVKIAIYSKRSEISVMLLVGATKSFIALPFVFQGMFLSTLGAVLSVVLLSTAYPMVGEVLHATLSFINLISAKNVIFRLYIILIGTGMTLGWLCSWVAVHQYIVGAVDSD